MKDKLVKVNLPALDGEAQHLEALEEKRACTHSIIYYIYKEKVIVIEEIEDNLPSDKITFNDLESALSTTSEWG